MFTSTGHLVSERSDTIKSDAIILKDRDRTRFDFIPGNPNFDTDVTLLCERTMDCMESAVSSRSWFEGGPDNNKYVVEYLCAFHTAATVVELLSPPF